MHTKTIILVFVVAAASSCYSFSFSLFGNEKIIGGSEATPHEYPWMVQVRRQGVHWCGGSLLNNEWVVTAGQCFTGQPSDYELVAGDHNIRQADSDQQNRQVVRVIVHEGYSAGNFENDIVLMQVSPPFLLNDYVSPIALAEYEDEEYFDNLTAIGWGSLTPGGASVDLLYHVDVPFVEDLTCKAVYAHSLFEESMLCAGANGKDSCRGDSGGPLIAYRNGTEPILAGIVSWGFGCGEMGYPGVYTEVPYFGGWVADEIASFEPEDNSTFVIQNSGCGGTLFGSSGQIAYNIDGDEDNRICTWTLRAGKQSEVRVEIYNLTMSQGDTFIISELDHTNGHVGNSSRIPIPGTYKFKGPTIFVTFVSASADLGFRLHFYGTGGTDSSLIGHAFANYFIGNTTDTFYYPVRGGFYTSNEFITIFISPPASRTLYIESINTQPNADYIHVHTFNSNGVYDYFSNYSGTTIPTPIRRDGPYLLTFVSDDSIENTGFLLSWND